MLSYNALDFRLKYMFVYFCLLPGKQEIRTRKLFRLYVAEGFAEDSEAEATIAEEIMELHWKQLVDLKLIVATGMGFSGNAETWRVSETFRDLALCILDKGILRQFCTYRGYDWQRPNNVRRLSSLGTLSTSL